MRRIRASLLLLSLLALLSGCALATTTHISAGREYDAFFALPCAAEQAEYLRSGEGFAPVCEGVFAVPRVRLVTHEDYRLDVSLFALREPCRIIVESLRLTDADGQPLYILPGGGQPVPLTETGGMYAGSLAGDPIPTGKVQPGSDLTLTCALLIDGESFELTWTFRVSKQKTPVFPA